MSNDKLSTHQFLKSFLRFFLLVSICLSIFLPLGVHAQDAADPRYQQKLKEIEELKSKINQLQGEAKTLSSAVAYLTNKKALTEKQVEATELEITILQKDIESLDGKIGLLEEKLDTLAEALLEEVKVGYKQPEIDSFHLLFSSKRFSDLYTRFKYVQLAQAHYQSLLKKTTEAKLEYDGQKVTKEKKQASVALLQKRLEQQKKDLEAQEAAKRKILVDTKNSEGNYQKQLAQAEAELASFRSFTASKGGGTLPPQNSPDGWFFSQRDERWGNYAIGNSGLSSSPDTIFDVGCLVASVAMVKKKYGENVTPITIAAVPSYFVGLTGSMNWKWPSPGGYTYERTYKYDKGLIDKELAEGRPVIIKLSVRTNSVGTHFIVFKSGQNGDYTMHDPWEGFDKKFASFYSTGQIIDVGYLRKT